MIKKLGQTSLKYMAIKVVGQHNWLWFEVSKTTLTADYMFIGNEGWGKNGSVTNIEISEDLIEGVIYSEALQYGKN